MPDTADLGMFDEVTFPLPPNFYDDYQHREAARVQDMTIAHTLRMDYDLKMYPEDTKDGNVLRMISAQRARYKAYYDPIEEDLESRNLNGKALTEWRSEEHTSELQSLMSSTYADF